MSILDRLLEWEKTDGAELFRRMGVREGSVVVDFGAGHGHFAMAAAAAAGKSGRVIALDRNGESIEALGKRALAEGVSNLNTILTDGGTEIGLDGGSVDFVLFYDILHMPGLNRAELIAEAHRVLRSGGVLSVLPFHMDDDRKTALEGEIVAAGFERSEQIPGAGLHCGLLYSAMEDGSADFESAERGTVYNYGKH